MIGEESSTASQQQQSPNPQVKPSWTRIVSNLSLPLRRLLQIFALANFAVAQPLFDLLGRNPEFFVAHQTHPMAVVALALGLSFVLPAIIGLTLHLVRHRLPRTTEFVHRAIAALLVAALTLLVLKQLPALPDAVLLGCAVVVGLAAALWALNPAALRFTTYLAVLSPVIPLTFLLFSPARDLWMPGPPLGALSSTPKVENPVPVVIVLFDELPISSLLDGNLEVDVGLFPNFAALASESVFFPRATTVAEATHDAVPALLTGRYPAKDVPANARSFPANLFTLLGADYKLNVVESGTRLCPASLCPEAKDGRQPTDRPNLIRDTWTVYLHLLAPSGLVSRLPPVNLTWKDFGGGGRVLSPGDGNPQRTVDTWAPLKGFLAELKAEPRASVHYLHLDLPHFPWRFLPSGKEYGPIDRHHRPPGLSEDTTWSHDPWFITQALQRHMLQLAYADRLLGQVLDRIRQVGIYEEAALVVTADHGMAFVPGHPARFVNDATYPAVMAIPLFLRLPGQERGQVSDLEVEIVDVLPTLADVLGMGNLPWKVDGFSVLSNGFPLRQHKTLTWGSGPRLTFPVESFGPRLARTVDHHRRLLRLDSSPSGLPAIGPRPDLVGRPVGELDVAEPCTLETALTHPWLFGQVDRDSGFLPAQVVGVVKADEYPFTEDLHLAVSLNGVVGVTTKAYRDGDDGLRFSALLPEELFVDGPNSIEIFLLDQSGVEPRLVPTRNRTGPTYSLSSSGAGEIVSIDASNGTTCKVDPESVEGELMRAGRNYKGWAADPSGERPMVIIMAFLDGRLLLVTATGASPPAESLAAARQPPDDSGFQFSLPESLVADDDQPARVRVFGVLGSRGSELRPRAD